MGKVIDFVERAADRSRPALGSAKFFFALECPLSYLASERVERALGEIEWVPVIAPSALAEDRLARAVEAAERLQLPLLDAPECGMDSRRASRVAVFAADHGAVHRYALAMARLVFCGGYPLDDNAVIAEAAACAGMDPRDAVAAADEPAYDLQIDATGRGLQKRGVAGAPAIRIGTSWFEGADPLLSLSAWSQPLG